MVAILNLCSHTYNTILFVLYPFHSPIDTVSSGTGALLQNRRSLCSIKIATGYDGAGGKPPPAVARG